MTWTCCGTAPWRTCSAGSAPRPRWARTCGRTPGETSCSSEGGPGAAGAPGRGGRRCCPAPDVLAFIDIDSTQKRVYGHRKQGAGFGHTKIQGKSLLVRGLNALAAAITTPLAAPVIAATRLRGGNANSARGAAGLAAQAISHRPRRPGAAALLVVRIGLGLLLRRRHAAIRRGGARFSVTVPVDPQDPRRDRRHRRGRLDRRSSYPRAIWDDQLGGWVSDAEVAETQYTAFTSKKKGRAITARLIVRRVRDLNAKAARGAGRAVPRLALPRRLHRLPVRARSRPRSSTATTPSSSRSSPTSATARSPTCHMLTELDMLFWQFMGFIRFCC